MAVNTYHNDYLKYSKDWQLIRNVLAGEVKNYIPTLNDVDKSEDDAYKNRPTFYNATSRTLDALVGLIHSKEADFTAPQKIIEYAKNITLDDDTIEDFTKMITKETLSVGRGGILVDMPNFDRSQVSTAEADAMGLRSYATFYKAEQIINWHTTNYFGITTLDLVVIAEYYTTLTDDEYTYETKTRYKVLDLKDGFYRIRVYNYEDVTKTFNQNGEDLFPLVQGNRLKYIPFIFINSNDLKSNITKSPLLDMAQINVSHLINEADIEHCAHLSALPTAFLFNAQVPSNEKIHLGSTVVNVVQGQGADAKFLEFTGNGIQALENRASVKEKRMAVLGARLLLDEKKTAEATETVAMRSSGERSVLVNLAMTVSSAITKALKIIAEWEGINGDIAYQLNTDYNLNVIDPQLLAQLMAGVQNGTMPLQVLYSNMVAGELIDKGVTYEQYQGMINEQAPMMSVSNARTNPTA